MKARHKSFTDPDTHYRLIKSDTPPSVDGYRIGEPTGEVECDECGAIAENVAAHYEWADQQDEEVDRLYAASVTSLSALAHSLGVPYLVSAPYASDEKRELLHELAVDEIEVERTELGYRFATEDFDTMGYWQHGW